MTVHTRAALARLHGAARDGTLAALCEAHRVDLMVLFGSAAITDREPGDIDVGVRFDRADEGDIVALVTDLVRLLGNDTVDVMDLRRADPVARYEAVARGELLYEADRRIFAEYQMFAVRDFIDTAPMRRLQLELMSR